MANRSAQAHLSSGQITKLQRSLRAAREISLESYQAEIRRQARNYGLRVDTIEELGRMRRKERTR